MLRRFVDEETGATSIEYGLIAVVVSVGIIVGVQAFAGSVSDLWFYASSQVVSNLE